MSAQENMELGPFAVVVVDSGKGPVPLRSPSLRVLAGREFVCGVVAFRGEYWLNGTEARIPFDRAKAIFCYAAEQEYLLALERHDATEKKRKAEGESGGKENPAEG